MVHGQMTTEESDTSAKAIHLGQLKEKQRALLIEEHRILDEQVSSLHTSSQGTATELFLLKRKKLMLKDQIEGRR
ncbi:MAG: hypothetical protein RLZZ76_572 [Candidatus Parcubacteria bacterium]|jgi:hypothetical protein